MPHIMWRSKVKLRACYNPPRPPLVGRSVSQSPPDATICSTTVRFFSHSPMEHPLNTPPSMLNHNKKLTAAHLKSTISLLQPRYWYLSPAFGAALRQAPAVWSNLVRVADLLDHDYEASSGNTPLTRAARLARATWFRPHAAAPWQPTRNHSRPAAYLTQPTVLGRLMGTFGVGDDDENHVVTNNQKELARTWRESCGVRSNYVSRQFFAPLDHHLDDKNGPLDSEWIWTGVSLQRWKELAECLSSVSSSPVSAAVWSSLVWHHATSKEDVLDYLGAIQDASSHEILQPFAQHLRTNPAARDEWCRDTFATEELDQVVQQPRSELHLLRQVCQPSDPTEDSGARSLELLYASLVHRQRPVTSLPVLTHGQFSLDQGPRRGDCVETAVRELVHLLLWQEPQGHFEPHRLPDEAHPNLKAYFQVPTPLAANKKTNSVETLEENIEHDKTPPLDWNELLSNLPDCDYLMRSPYGLKYELRPSLENVAKVCQKLFYPATQRQSGIWTSLYDLQRNWNQDHPSLPLHVALGTLQEPSQTTSSMTRPTLITHQVATLYLEGGSQAIEMRLRYDTWAHMGFATVTHHLLGQVEQEEESSLSTKSKMELAKQLLELLNQNPTATAEDNDHNRSWLASLALALLGESGLTLLSKDASLEVSFDTLWIAVLASPYGLDRRKLTKLAAKGQDSPKEAYGAAYQQSLHVLQTALEKICHHVQALSKVDKSRRQHGIDDVQKEVDLALVLLRFILTESPHVSQQTTSSSVAPSMAVTFDQHVDDLILSLPIDMVANNPIIHLSLSQTQWVGRGPMLSKVLHWKSGNATLSESFRYLGTSDAAALAVLMLRQWHPSVFAKTN